MKPSRIPDPLLRISRGFDHTTGLDAVPRPSLGSPSFNLAQFTKDYENSWTHTLDPGTVRNYKSHIQGYLRFANAMEISPFPVSFRLITQYFFYFVVLAPHRLDTPNLKVFHSTNTLRGIYSAVKMYAIAIAQFNLSEVENKAAIRYYDKTLPKLYPPKPDHRFPIRMCLLLKAWTVRARGSPDLSTLTWVDLRDRAYQATAHQGLFRTSELLALTSDDICFNMDSSSTSKPSPTSVTLKINHAKTENPKADQGIQRVHIPFRPNQPNLCVVSILSLWLNRIGLLNKDFTMKRSQTKTLWPVSESQLDHTLPKKTVIATLRDYMKSIGFPEDLLHLVTAHGMRTGGACDLRDSGTDIEVILTQGRWTGRGFKSYLRSSAETSASVLRLSSESDFAIPMADLKVGDGSLADKYNMALNSIHRYCPKETSDGSISSSSTAIQSGPALSSFVFKPPSYTEGEAGERPSIEPLSVHSTVHSGTPLNSGSHPKRRKVASVPTAPDENPLPEVPQSKTTSTSLVNTSSVTAQPVLELGLRSSRNRTPVPTRRHRCDE